MGLGLGVISGLLRGYGDATLAQQEQKEADKKAQERDLNNALLTVAGSEKARPEVRERAMRQYLERVGGKGAYEQISVRLPGLSTTIQQEYPEQEAEIGPAPPPDLGESQGDLGPTRPDPRGQAITPEQAPTVQGTIPAMSLPPMEISGPSPPGRQIFQTDEEIHKRALTRKSQEIEALAPFEASAAAVKEKAIGEVQGARAETDQDARFKQLDELGASKHLSPKQVSDLKAKLVAGAFPPTPSVGPATYPSMIIEGRHLKGSSIKFDSTGTPIDFGPGAVYKPTMQGGKMVGVTRISGKYLRAPASSGALMAETWATYVEANPPLLGKVPSAQRGAVIEVLHARKVLLGTKEQKAEQRFMSRAREAFQEIDNLARGKPMRRGKTALAAIIGGSDEETFLGIPVGGVKARAGGYVRRAQAALGHHPALATLQRIAPAFAAMMWKLYDKGRISDQDRDLAIGAYTPSASMTEEEWALQTTIIKGVFDRADAQILEAYIKPRPGTSPLPEGISPPLGAPEAAGQGIDSATEAAIDAIYQ